MTDEVASTIEAPKKRGRPSTEVLYQELERLREQNAQYQAALISRPAAPMPMERVAPSPVAAEPVSTLESRRLLRMILGDRDFDVVMLEGNFDKYAEKYQTIMQGRLQWEAQTPCQHCGARPGYDPMTGTHVRSWEAGSRSWIEGHRASCLTRMRAAR